MKSEREKERKRERSERRQDEGSRGGSRSQCVPLFRGFIAAVGINEGPCFHGDRVAVQISFYYLPRGIYLATRERESGGGQGAVPVVVGKGTAGKRIHDRARHDAAFDGDRTLSSATLPGPPEGLGNSRTFP